MMNGTSKIKSDHLRRKAVVYIRQSSEKQVLENLESQRLQYAMTDRARDLGWVTVEVMDIDLGVSAAAATTARKGFERLIASVATEEIGIIFSREVSRLSRNDKDWCRLLEVCHFFDTLIADDDHVYDLSLLDDQLILGIKGTMSVVELKILQKRLAAGTRAKAERGELVRMLPPGYIYDNKGSVVKDPDLRIREAVALIFRKFRELGSGRQTFRYFHSENIKLPVNKKSGSRMGIVWQTPSQSFIRDTLKNPFYAGAYFWGRRQTKVKMVNGSPLKKSTGILSPEEFKVLLKNHHEAYITWDYFEENTRLLRGNYLKNGIADESVTAIRSGQGVLVGLLRCGRCGRKFHVRYWGKSGTAARYLCKGDFDCGGKYCLAFGGSTVDRRFNEEILRVVSPLGVKASLKAIKELTLRDEDKHLALERQLRQVEYDATRAFEQYDESDPRNRLVAAELERRWNMKLEEVEELRTALEGKNENNATLTKEQCREIIAMGADFHKVWNSRTCPIEMRKKIIRAVVEEVIVNLDEETQTLRFVVHWRGGCHTEFDMIKPVSGVGKATSDKDLEIIRKMAVRYDDDQIARVLTKLGRRTARDKRWCRQIVKSTRSRYSIPAPCRNEEDSEILTLGQTAKYCGISQTAIKRLTAKGILKKEQVVPWAPWEIKRSDLTTEPINGIIKHLKKTGKLVFRIDSFPIQDELFELESK